MASISSVKICNMALAHVGDSATIESLSEASPEAKVCNLWYDWSRLQTIEAHNWTFSRKRKVLAVLETDASVEWIYRYGYPSDCVKALLLVNPLGKSADAVPYDVETSDDGQTTTILTNLEEAELLYSFDVTDPVRFSSLFIDALAWRIASRIAFSLTGQAALADAALRSYGQHILMAQTSNANEGQEGPPRDAEWIRGR